MKKYGKKYGLYVLLALLLILNVGCSNNSASTNNVANNSEPNNQTEDESNVSPAKVHTTEDLAALIEDADTTEDGAVIIDRDLLYKLVGPESTIVENHWHILGSFGGDNYTKDYSQSMFKLEDDVNGNILVDFENHSKVPVLFWTNTSDPSTVPAGDRVFEIVKIEDLPEGTVVVNASQADGEAFTFKGKIYIEERD